MSENTVPSPEPSAFDQFFGKAVPPPEQPVPDVVAEVNELNALKAALLIDLLRHIDPYLATPCPMIGRASLVESVNMAKECINRIRSNEAVRPQPGEYWKNREGFVEGPLFAIPQEAGGPEGFILGAMSNGHMSAWRQDGTCNVGESRRSPHDLIQRVGKPEAIPEKKDKHGHTLHMGIPTEGSQGDA